MGPKLSVSTGGPVDLETMEMTKMLGNKAVRGLALMGMTAAALAGAPVLAANQGSVGATSTGSIAITASVPSRARISNLTDVNFTSVDPSSAVSHTQGPCVWSNTATRKYTLTASGSGTGGAFTLTDGAIEVPYSVGWAAAAGATTVADLTAGTSTSALTATANNINCTAGVDSTLKVSIGADDLQDMVAANTYQGTLTLVVTPQ